MSWVDPCPLDLVLACFCGSLHEEIQDAMQQMPQLSRALAMSGAGRTGSGCGQVGVWWDIAVDSSRLHKTVHLGYTNFIAKDFFPFDIKLFFFCLLWFFIL